MDFRSLRTGRLSAEEGSAVMFMAVCLIPIVFFAFSLGLDISSLYTAKNNEERLLQSAAILASRQLPYQGLAEQTAREYLVRHSKFVTHPESEALQVSVQPDQIFLKLRLEVEVPFSSYFGAKKTLKLDSVARAQVLPRDVAIFFDSGSNLSPQPGGSHFWGKEVVPQSVGYYTGFLATTEHSDLRDWTPHPRFEALAIRNGADAAVLAQQCFNPAFSAVKQGAIRLFDYLSSFKLNSVGVYSGPSRSGGIVRHRGIREAGAMNGEAEAFFEDAPYTDVRDSDCLAAAEDASPGLQRFMQRFWSNYDPTDPSAAGEGAGWNLPAIRQRYAVPNYSIELDPARLAPYGRGRYERITDPRSGRVVSSQLKLLTARESIWSKVAHPEQLLSTESALRVVVGDMLSASKRLEQRGHLAESVFKTVYFILGDFPAVRAAGHEYRFPDPIAERRLGTALREMDSRANSLNNPLRLYLIVVRNSGMEYSCQNMDCPEYHEDFERFNSFVGSLNSRLKNIRIAALRVPDVGSIAQDLASYLPLSEKRVVLANNTRRAE